MCSHVVVVNVDFVQNDDFNNSFFIVTKIWN